MFLCDTGSLATDGGARETSRERGASSSICGRVQEQARGLYADQRPRIHPVAAAARRFAGVAGELHNAGDDQWRRGRWRWPCPWRRPCTIPVERGQLGVAEPADARTVSSGRQTHGTAEPILGQKSYGHWRRLLVL
jgi:hypothetical protein